MATHAPSAVATRVHLGSLHFLGNIFIAYQLGNVREAEVGRNAPLRTDESGCDQKRTAKIGVEKHSAVWLVPVEAMMVEKTGSSIFIAADGRAKKVPVKIGFNDGALVEIVEGLPPNAPVILVGKMTLVNGQSVNVAEAK